MKELIYDYLLNNCVGCDNRIKGWQLMKLFNIKDHKTLRGYIQELRNDEDIEELIGSVAGKGGGFFIIRNYTEYRDTIDHLYLRAMEMLKTREVIMNKKNKQERKI